MAQIRKMMTENAAITSTAYNLPYISTGDEEA
jgi:hypothetical protein